MADLLEVRRDPAGIEKDLETLDQLIADAEAHGLARVVERMRIRRETLAKLLEDARAREAPRCCATCRHDLGGGWGNCRINLEAECADGFFEAWEPR